MTHQAREIENLLADAATRDDSLLASRAGSRDAVEDAARAHCQRHNFAATYTAADIASACARYAECEWASWEKAL